MAKPWTSSVSEDERQQELTYPLLSMAPVAVILVDENGHITHANELAQSYLGTSLRRLSGIHLSQFIQPSSEVEAMLKRALQGETVADDGFCGRENHIPYSVHFGCRQGEDGVVIVLIPEANRSEVEEHVHRHEMAEAVARIALEMDYCMNKVWAMRARLANTSWMRLNASANVLIYFYK